VAALFAAHGSRLVVSNHVVDLSASQEAVDRFRAAVPSGVQLTLDAV
jgi:hypothetical protein